MVQHRRQTVAVLIGLTLGVASKAVVDAPPAEPPATPARKSGQRSLPVVAGLGGVVAVGAAVPVVRRTATSWVLKLLGRDEEAYGDFDSVSEPPDTKQPSVPPSNEQVESDKRASALAAAEAEAERFMLTPDKLSEISELNSKLERVADNLTSVPVFTAAVGNGTSPLTVPAEDGKKLAYFFLEKADAEAFLRAVRENTGVELQAQVIGVSLADIVRAYGSPDAREAKETFVLIPTMAEVAAARHMMRSAGKEADPSKLSAGSGLVPLFWCESLAVQTAGGQQRKVLFLRLGDLQQMWGSLAKAREEAAEKSGELDGTTPPEPVVQVSDLQTMAGALADAGKLDEVLFLPSSVALKHAQASAGRARARGGGAQPEGQPDASQPDASQPDASQPEGAEADAADVDVVDDFAGEEEEAIGL